MDMDIHEPSDVEHGHSGQILFSSAGRHLPKAGRSHDRAAAVGLQARRCDLLGHNTHRDGGLAEKTFAITRPGFAKHLFAPLVDATRIEHKRHRQNFLLYIGHSLGSGRGLQTGHDLGPDRGFQAPRHRGGRRDGHACHHLPADHNRHAGHHRTLIATRDRMSRPVCGPVAGEPRERFKIKPSTGVAYGKE